MTSLDKRKTKLTFQTCDTVRERGRLREVVIQAEPYIALVRLAGTRTSYPISYAAIFHAAASIKARQELAEKAKAKKQAKENRRKR